MKVPNEKPVVPEDLYNILARADRIVVKDSPMTDARTLFESTDKRDLADLRASLLLETPAESFHCMCIGTPALYVYERGGKPVELTNHHGESVRCSLWTSDVRISDTEKWLSWFDERRITSPRREVEAMRAQQEQGERDWDRWLAAMPKAIRAIWADALGQFGSVDVTPLRAALERDMPDERQRILALLEWFGSGAGPWSPCPSYETAAEELLLGYSTMNIVKALESTKISPAQTEGGARLFAGWSFRKQRPRGVNEVPDALKKVLWNHVKDTEDKDKLGRAKRALSG
jgi:hypothetical protein